MNLFYLDALLAEARARTNSSDFGPADFIAPLEALLVDLNRPGAIPEDRVEALRERLLRLLVNRAWFAKDWAEHPEIADEVIKAPIEIVALARTGSTKLHRLLGASGDFQTLPMWKSHMFARIPGLPDGGEAERIARVREYEAWMLEASPDIRSGHPMFTEETEEDQWLGECTFRRPMSYLLFDSPTLMQYQMQHDPAPGYAYFFRQLQYLQWQNRQLRGAAEAAKPWLLKSPDYLGSEAQLTAIFKQPRLIVTHRNPIDCVPSGAAMTRHFRMLYTGSLQTESVSSAIFQFMAQLTSAHTAWRDAHPQQPVLDVAFREITFEGMSAARRVYDYLQMPLSAEAERHMRRWEDDNRQDKHGKNAYATGANDDEIRALFAGYIARYSKYF